MSEKIKITPRAQRLLRERGLRAEQIGIGVKGTGFLGGITEKDLLAWLAENPPDRRVAGAPRDDASVIASEAKQSRGPIRATSLARKIAAERSINLEYVKGSGSFGKIVTDDVLDYEPEVAQTKDGKRIAKVVPYSGVRKIIGDRLHESKRNAPHLYFTQKADMSGLLELRAEVNSKQDIKTSVTDYIAKAVIKTLQTFPEMNASLTTAGIEEYESINLGIAVAAPGGLIVPVVKEAQRLGVIGIAKEAGLLIEKARAGKLAPQDYSGGTFTISNLGMFGIENFTAILNPPEVGILSVSAIIDSPAVVKNSDGSKMLDIRPLMNMTLTVDHRVIDGLLAAQFVTEVKRLLENPAELMEE